MEQIGIENNYFGLIDIWANGGVCLDNYVTKVKNMFTVSICMANLF